MFHMNKEDQLKGLTDQIFIKKINNEKINEIYNTPVASDVYVNGEQSSLYINFIIFNVTKEIKGDYKKIHEKIKRDINEQNKKQGLSIALKDILYDYWVKTPDEYIVFYLSTKKGVDFNLIGDFKYSSIFRILFNCHFKGRIIKKIDIQEIDVENKCFNNNLFISVNSKNKFYNCFENKFYFKDEEILGFELKYQVFVKVDEKVFVDEYNDGENNIIFSKFGKEEKINLKRIDGRKSPRKYFSQYDYSKCKNFSQNWVLKEMMNTLNELDIGYECINFSPNYIFVNLFRIERENAPKLYIDKNIDYEQNKEDISNFMKDLNIDLINKDMEYEKLSESENIILVNNVEKQSYIYSEKEGSQKKYMTTIEAFEDNENIDNFDPYTKIKIQHLRNIFENKNKKITQGILLDNIKDRKKMKSVLEKMKNELFLKKSLFLEKKIKFKNEENFNEEKVLCLYIRSTKKRKYFTILECSIKDEWIFINNIEILDLENFEKKYDFFDVKSITTKYLDDSFFIWNKNKILHIKNDKCPAIIGNFNAIHDENLNLIEIFNKTKMIHKKSGADVNLLPFYLSRTNGAVIENYKKMKNNMLYGKLYIEAKNNCFRTFLSDNAQYGKTGIAKQTLIDEVLMYQENEGFEYKEFFDINDDLLKIYLNSLTFDTINIGETSKKSIFQKLTELIINN